MRTRRRPTAAPVEPVAWATWRAHLDGLPELTAFEFGCYTDVWPIGEVDNELGPVKLLNPVAGGVPGEARMAIVIRLGMQHTPQTQWRPRLRTEYGRYVAVDAGEELASLVSLALAMRCRSGGLIREFRRGGDPRGRPIGFEHAARALPRPLPLHGVQLPLMASSERGHRREVHLAQAVELLRRYPSTSQRKAIALVRAARLYARAIWTADADPEFAWISLITACEVAAAHRYGSRDPMKKHQKKPAIPQATQRFIEFVARYAPDPPDVRPSYGQLDWSQMRQHARLVYHWRSRALHDGIPFPPPMVEPPHLTEDRVPVEIPMGLGTSLGTASWRVEHTPMLLHTFAFVTRHALLQWWRETRVRR